MAHGAGDLWTVRETMAYLDLSRSKVYALLAQGDLIRVHIGRRAWVLRSSVLAYVARAVSAATPPGGLPLGTLHWDQPTGSWRPDPAPGDPEGLG